MWSIALFEIKTRLKRISTWVYFAMFFAISVLWTAAAGGAFARAKVIFGSEKVWINAPFAIMYAVSVLGMLGVPIISAMMGRAVQQDFESNTHHFFFSSPISKTQYLGGRFIGTLVVLLLVFSSIVFGLGVGTLWPGVDAERVGSTSLVAYVWPYVALLIPNLILLGAVFLGLGALTRRMMPVYVVSTIFLIGYLASMGLLEDMENKPIASLLDPSGVAAIGNMTDYWPVSERNTRLVPLTGYFLGNRVLWLSLGLVIAALCFWRFSFQHSLAQRKQKTVEDTAQELLSPVAGAWQQASPEHKAAWRLIPGMAWLYLKETVKNVYFGVILLTGVLLVFAMASTMGSLYGTNTHPVTYQVLDLVSGSFTLFMLIILTFYAGELLWRERDHRVDQITDVMPVPTWVPMASKLLALLALPVIVQIVAMLCGIIIQTVKGYTNYELPLYVKHLFGLQLINYWMLAVFAFTVHVIINNKYLGHFVMVLYFIATFAAVSFGWEHRLYRLFQIGTPMYSDMNAFGHFIPRIRWLQFYWLALAVALLFVARLMWVRGTLTDWRSRLKEARSRLTLPTVAGVCASLLAFVLIGSYIFYNTNILNRYQTSFTREAAQARYEKTYKALAVEPQPKVVAVSINTDLFPREQRVRASGVLTLENRNSKPVERVYLNMLERNRIRVNKLEFSPAAKLAKEDKDLGFMTYALAEPLQPGAKLMLNFDIEHFTQGFRNDGSNTQIVGNGSFINNYQLLPSIGYAEQAELSSDNDRRKHGLKPKERMRDRDDPVGLQTNYVTADADWISYEATVSTEPDQIAIAPGYLKREWTENGRRYFHYRMESPILNFYAFLSARYEVRRDKWNDVDIEIYYHPGHTYNLDRMIAATKDSLDYFTTNFGPYQHRVFRIIEFPRYERFAQAFPNTIPYSESIGFIAKVDENDEKDIDYPYYVTAHEMAHQWWAHQVIGGNVQGSTLLSESLAQYSSLMVMKKKYGEARMKRFLRYELERYLTGRGVESKKELPLGRVENQPYIHYAKGSLVMYALQDYLGESNLNQAIRKYRDAVAYKGPPYTNVTEFLRYLREAAPSDRKYLVDDLFETITLYENRALEASAVKRGENEYEVTLKVAAKKLRADEKGTENEIPIADYVDIGVLDKKGNPLYLEKKRIDKAETEWKIMVKGLPDKAGIDPINKLIDRTPSDNVTSVKISG